MNLRNYAYTYDALNRLTAATGGANDNYDVSGIQYDKNGNIRNLIRKGHLDNTTTPAFGIMDNLDYDYGTANGNKLLKVKDTGVAPIVVKGQFQDKNTSGNDYTYDANGNMKSDANKGITKITYYHLNLPKTVVINDGGSNVGTISYIYDATGVKLKKEISTGAITEYAGNYVYENSSLKFFNHPEGYIEPDDSGEYDYVYQYKDHLGNIRLSYTDINNNGAIEASTEIVEENNYYPFGLKHKGYNNVTSANSNSVASKFQYNGKELQDELGLNWYDYGARNYDASLGRWMSIDPLSELYDDNSSYAYVLNNPILYVDPDGMKIDLSDIFRSKAGLQAGLQILLDLSEQTGLSLSVNNSSEGAFIEYLKDDNGDAMVKESDGGQKQGSETARNDLIGAIDDTRVLNVSLQTYNLGSKAGGLVMGIDPEQINTQIESVSDNLNSKTLGYGMTFLHELQHTDLGGNLSDTKKEFAKGPTVERVNTIREELDNNPNSTNQKQYGIRKAYMADEVSRTSVNKNYERIIGKNQIYST